VLAFAEEIYRNLNKSGFDVIMDLRDERAGVKFKDADLIGFHLRLVISSRNLSKGMVEISLRKEDKAGSIKAEEIEREIKKLLDKK
jgi:prolyl-tRNA synthetase